MSVAAIVPAAGRGERLGGEQPKAFRLLGGAPLLVHAVGALRGSRYVEYVVVAAPADRLAEVSALLGPGVIAVAGGTVRRDSVAAALAALPPGVDAAGLVTGTVPREELRAVQTPQGFRREVLAKAHAAAGSADPATDDAGLVERLGIPVATVPGSGDAMKITTPLDLLIAEAILRARH